jgi:hypothetical protein
MEPDLSAIVYIVIAMILVIKFYFGTCGPGCG